MQIDADARKRSQVIHAGFRVRVQPFAQFDSPPVPDGMSSCRVLPVAMGLNGPRLRPSVCAWALGSRGVCVPMLAPLVDRSNT